MSKSKTKRARREAKRESNRKTVAHARKALKAAKTAGKLNTTPSAGKQAESTQPPAQPKRRKSEVPFGEYVNILLVGEGDFSFTHSIVTHHGCANVTATSYDDEEEVLRKYPHTASLLTELRDLTPPVPIHHAIDATKLASHRVLRSSAPYDFIIFNFPHTGGLSKDVNRQVRANQELLVKFFGSIVQTTQQQQAPSQSQSQTNTKLSAEKTTAVNADKVDKKKEKEKKHIPLLSPTGKILVTLFEGEPYTLWNIRDLARHSGLRVLSSFKFDWSLYPGYSHARTLGVVDGDGGWKGEEREARSYLFERPLEGEGDGDAKKKKKRKRAGGESSGSEEEED